MNSVLSDASVRRILTLYPIALSTQGTRQLRNETDLATCKELLDLFPAQEISPEFSTAHFTLTTH
jgi:hypothetical protein